MRPDGRVNPAPSSDPAELVDVVDEHDRVIDTVTRSRMRAERLRHRAVFAMVRHPDGRLLVHRRSEHKDLWPGWWDIAVGGVVTAGEGYDAAIRRELAEEIGLVDVAVVHVGDGGYVDDEVALVGRCYLVEHAGPFEFADGEVTEARWVDRQQLAEMRRESRFLPDSLALFAPLGLVDPSS